MAVVDAALVGAMTLPAAAPKSPGRCKSLGQGRTKAIARCCSKIIRPPPHLPHATSKAKPLYGRVPAASFPQHSPRRIVTGATIESHTHICFRKPPSFRHPHSSPPSHPLHRPHPSHLFHPCRTECDNRTRMLLRRLALVPEHVPHQSIHPELHAIHGVGNGRTPLGAYLHMVVSGQGKSVISHHAVVAVVPIPHRAFVRCRWWPSCWACRAGPPHR